MYLDLGATARESQGKKYPAKAHLAKVVAHLEVDQGLIYLVGSYAFTVEDSDQPKTWRQRRYFYYCSGVEEPNCCLGYDIARQHLVLYVPRINYERIVWQKPGLTLEEALDKYDVDDVRLNEDLFDDLRRWTHYRQEHGKATIYVLHKDHRPQTELDATFESDKLLSAIDKARIIKDAYEIARIEQANSITSQAHRAVLQHLSSFTNEAQVAGRFLDTCVSHQAKKQSYEIIAGSGPNASILHYTGNDQDFQDRQLMVLDAGAEYASYTSDVTRTFPLRVPAVLADDTRGWPSVEARQIYELVAEAQERCIQQLRPGVRFIDVHVASHVILIQGLLRIGLLHQGTWQDIYAAGTSRGFYPHGLGHSLGLDVHDTMGEPVLRYRDSSTQHHDPDANDSTQALHEPCPPVLDLQTARWPCRPKAHALRQGMVVTVEPGCYFNRTELERAYLHDPVHSRYINHERLGAFWAVGGVRIEDDILITADGYRNLTTAPKGAEALEIIRRGKSCED